MLSEQQQRDLLEDYATWSGGLPISYEQIIAYLETACPYPFAHEQETDAIDYLASQICD